MNIIKTNEKKPCCKCENIATHTVIHKGNNFYTCDLHSPNQIDILRANDQIVNLKGREYVLFSGLLDLAHRNGLQSMKSELIEFSMVEKYAVIQATVTGSRGTFTAYSDSTQENTGKMVQSAFIRMCETRAYARALRLYLGIGLTAREELPPQ